MKQKHNRKITADNYNPIQSTPSKRNQYEIENTIKQTYRFALYSGFFDLLTVVEKLCILQEKNDPKYYDAIHEYCRILHEYCKIDFRNTNLIMSNRNSPTTQTPSVEVCLDLKFPHLEKVCKIKEKHDIYTPVYNIEMDFLQNNLLFVETLNKIEINNKKKFDIFLHCFNQFLTLKPTCKNQVENNTFTLHDAFYNKIDELSTASQNIPDNELYNLYVKYLELDFWCYYKVQPGKTIETNMKQDQQKKTIFTSNQQKVLQLIQEMYLSS